MGLLTKFDPFSVSDVLMCSCGSRRVQSGFEKKRGGTRAAVWVCQQCGRYDVYDRTGNVSSGPGPYLPPLDLEEITVQIEGGAALFTVEHDHEGPNPVTRIGLHNGHLSVRIPIHEFSGAALYHSKDGFCSIDVDLGHGQWSRIGFEDYSAWKQIVSLLSAPRLGIDNFEALEV